VQAIRVVAAGDALLAPSVTKRLIGEFARRPKPAARTAKQLELLTEREREVLTEVARGLTNAEIAARLHVAETTVKTHVAHVLDKLELTDRVQALVLAYETGLAGARLAARLRCASWLHVIRTRTFGIRLRSLGWSTHAQPWRTWLETPVSPITMLSTTRSSATRAQARKRCLPGSLTRCAR